MPPSAQLLLLEERADGAYLVPSAPLGPWAKRPLARILRAVEPGTRLTLDLTWAPVTEPMQVAGVLWVAREAANCDVALAVEVADMVSAELLAFSGLEAAVQMAQPPAAAPEQAAQVRGY